MGVKGIFKTLVGTTVIIVMISLIAEYINIATNSSFMKGIMMRSITKACDYFSQETYKEGAMGNIVGNMPDIQGRAGAINGIGRFFNGTNIDTVYDDIYTNSMDFKAFMHEHPGVWENLDMLYYGLYKSPLPGGMILDDGQKDMGAIYGDIYQTPVNLGIVYLDKGVVERILRYNIVATLSNGNSNNIYNDVAGSHYVLYNGFKVYYEAIQINNIIYTVYDTTIEDEREAFEALTNIDVGTLGITGDSGKICVATIHYAMPISYQGVTPLKKIMEYVWNSQVDGIDGNTITAGGYTFNEANLATLTQDTRSISMPVDGEIIYYNID